MPTVFELLKIKKENKLTRTAQRRAVVVLSTGKLCIQEQLTVRVEEGKKGKMKLLMLVRAYCMAGSARRT